MSLPMFSHPWELLLNKIWWKSMRGMFEIFTPIFLFLQPRGRKIRSDTKKYISEWSSGYELYWGTWVFIPKWWDHMKKWLRKHDENQEVLEPRFPSLPSWHRNHETLKTRFLFLPSWKGEKTKAWDHVVRKGEKNKYRGGTSDATTSSLSDINWSLFT